MAVGPLVNHDHPRATVATAASGRAPARVTGVLTTIFNCFALNAALVLACLPVVTIPVALRAAVVTLDRWRADGEDRVVVEFMLTLRASRLRSTTASVGIPIVAALLALGEIRFFASAHTAAKWPGVALSADGLLLSLASAGYAVVLAARCSGLPPTTIWWASASLTVRNLIGASPLLVAEIAVVAVVLLRDPALVVVCVPLGLVALIRHTAGRPVETAIGLDRDRERDPSDAGAVNSKSDRGATVG